MKWLRIDEVDGLMHRTAIRHTDELYWIAVYRGPYQIVQWRPLPQPTAERLTLTDEYGFHPVAS